MCVCVCSWASARRSQVIRTTTGRTSIGGITSYSEPFRKISRALCFAADTGILPDCEKVHYSAACGAILPCLCTVGDGNLCAELVRFNLLREFRSCVMQHPDVGEGSVVEVRTTLRDGDTCGSMILEVAHIRRKNPKLTLFIPWDRTDASLQRRTGILAHWHFPKQAEVHTTVLPICDTDVLKTLWTPLCSQLWCMPMLVEESPHEPTHLAVIGMRPAVVSSTERRLR